MTKEEFEKLDRNEVEIIDIRRPEELIELPSVEGAVNIPLAEMAQKIQSGALDKSKKIVTVCRSGGRCMMLHQYLQEQGYESDYLDDGILSLQ